MLRALLLIGHVVYGLGICVRLLLDKQAQLRKPQIAQRWHRRLLRIVGLRLHVEGTPLKGAHLTAANHVSWLDIPVIGALEPTRFIAKSEVREWPIAGFLARAAGTFFIRRGRGGAAPLLDKLVPYLRAGGSVVLFPEGTTTDGTQVRTFHSRLFSAALDAQCPVQPVTIQYGLTSGGQRIAPFIGDDSLVAHILRLLRNDELDVQVRYGPPLAPEAMTRDALAEEAESFVRGALVPAMRPANVEAAALPRWSEA